MSWIPKVLDENNEWHLKAAIFATKEEAGACASSINFNWMFGCGADVEETELEPTHKWNFKKRSLVLIKKN